MFEELPGNHEELMSVRKINTYQMTAAEVSLLWWLRRVDRGRVQVLREPTSPGDRN
ncbi:MAG: hypothetical protein HC786_02970 [Richelia sp. CSU_2_1]|nr:hypothetical protein [Richelia sp. CSU_2_1]